MTPEKANDTAGLGAVHLGHGSLDPASTRRRKLPFTPPERPSLGPFPRTGRHRGGTVAARQPFLCRGRALAVVLGRLAARAVALDSGDAKPVEVVVGFGRGRGVRPQRLRAILPPRVAGMNHQYRFYAPPILQLLAVFDGNSPPSRVSSTHNIRYCEPIWGNTETSTDGIARDRSKGSRLREFPPKTATNRKCLGFDAPIPASLFGQPPNAKLPDVKKPPHRFRCGGRGFPFTSATLQQLLHRRRDDIGNAGRGLEAADDVAVAIDEKLREVPLDVGLTRIIGIGPR